MKALAAALAAMVCVTCSTVAYAETDEERAARIEAAARALQEAKQETTSPEALQARVKELEEENRALRIELTRLKAMIESAGLNAAADNDKPIEGEKPRRAIRSMRKVIKAIPVDAFPEKVSDRSKQHAYSDIQKQRILNAMKSLDGTQVRLRVRLLNPPTRKQVQLRDIEPDAEDGSKPVFIYLLECFVTDGDKAAGPNKTVAFYSHARTFVGVEGINIYFSTDQADTLANLSAGDTVVVTGEFRSGIGLNQFEDEQRPGRAFITTRVAITKPQLVK